MQKNIVETMMKDIVRWTKLLNNIVETIMNKIVETIIKNIVRWTKLLKQ